ncbi:hypothetical protein Cgig2_029180 [Carnegiea gigantea]|uniref:GDSL esterase/lipase At5g03980-like n=1 Tax=Carnegiea gigantea TaxID=171969 RepID=A0A9Q1KIG8_9CARY|nr:hypothetical protein Cgig2_029180 [Carnegiea gigantea]
MADARSSKSLLFLLLLLLFSLLNLVPGALVVSASSDKVIHDKLSFDRIFQFGDSLSDTGNLIRDNPIGGHPFSSFPYGQTIHRPTGRCSDGLLMIDYIAKFFHLPLLNPYLNKQANFTFGVNFAVAGSTALDTATLRAKGIISPATNSSLSIQLNWFSSHLHSMHMCGGNLDCMASVVGKSLVMMGEVGGNDYNYALLEGKSMEELYKMVPEVVRAIKEAVKEVINMGAIRIVVPGNFPIGCMPIYLALFETQDSGAYDELRCLKGLNDFAKFHNEQLKAAIRELRREHPNVAVVYGDYYHGLRWIVKNAASLGFNKDGLQKTCCGSGNNKYNFNLTRMCGYEGTTVCEDPSESYSWDGIHLTQHAYLHMAQWLLRRIVPGILQFEQQSFPITGSENTEKQGQIDQAQETLEIKNSISSSRTSTKAASALPRTSFEAFANSPLAIFLRESQY